MRTLLDSSITILGVNSSQKSEEKSSICRVRNAHLTGFFNCRVRNAHLTPTHRRSQKKNPLFVGCAMRTLLDSSITILGVNSSQKSEEKILYL
jgi:hypothetical protein